MNNTRLAPKLSTGLLLLAVTACSGAGELQFEPWLFPLPEGTPVREYPPRPPDGPDAFGFVEDLVIGDHGTAEAILYQPTDVAVSADGTVFVADAGAHHIKVFEADGIWRHNLGGEGQGPGEFDGSDIRLTIAGGRLIAHDTGNDRFSVWTLDGAYVADHKPGASRRPRSLFGLADGSLVWDYLSYGEDGTTRELAERIDVEGGRLATLVDRPGPPVRRFPNDPADQVQAFLDALEDPRLVLAGADDVVYFSPGAQYQLLAMTPNGDPLWALRRAGPPPDIPIERRGPFVAGIEQQSRVPLDLSADDINWPERIPAIYDLRVDGRGRLFVFLPPEGWSLLMREIPPESWRVHIYSSAGEYLGAGTVPAQPGLMGNSDPWSAVRDDHVYRIATNTSDEPVVIRYRIELIGE